MSNKSIKSFIDIRKPFEKIQAYVNACEERYFLVFILFPLVGIGLIHNILAAAAVYLIAGKAWSAVALIFGLIPIWSLASCAYAAFKRDHAKEVATEKNVEKEDGSEVS